MFRSGLDQLGKRIHAKVTRNPMLHFQIESQLRRRITQELELLAADSTDKITLLLCSEEQTRQISGEKPSLDIASFGEPRPAAFLKLQRATPDAQGEEELTRLVPLRDETRRLGLATPLAAHRVPLYDLCTIFAVPSLEPHGSKSSQKAKGKPKHNTQVLRTLQDLASTHPEMYERELKSMQETESAIKAALTKLGANEGQDLVYLPAGDKRWTPLLISLWRWRMWIGEGWSGDGFGVLEATGRKAVM